MKGVIQIARFAGIPVKLHWTFGLLILWVVYAAVSSGLDLTGVFLSVAIVSTIFICVVMHEYGHALTARRYGVKTRDIILSPIGGIARLSHIPHRPAHEMLIALAGPAVNLVIAFILLTIIGILDHRIPQLFVAEFWSLGYEQSVLLIIAKINVFLVVFNMVPAFPMDGGRVFRALLSLRFERTKATLYASYLGSLFAAGFVLLGIMHNELVLSLIGIFIFFAASQERKMALTRQRLQNLSAGQICNRDPKILQGSHVLRDVLSDTKDNQKKDFLIADEQGSVVGVLFEELIQDAISNGYDMRPVRSYASQLYTQVNAQTSVDTVIELFRKEGYRLVPVYENDALIGSIHRNRLEFLLRGGDPQKVNMI